MSLTTPITYADTAYRPDRIPLQLAPSGRPEGTSALDHHLSVRLPWGYTEEVTPSTLLRDTEPTNLARIEKLVAQQNTLRGEFDEQFDHICIRPVSLSGGSRFWNIMYQMGRMTFGMMLFFVLLAFLSEYFFGNTKGSFIDQFIGYLYFSIIPIGLPFCLWVLSSLYFRLFPVKAGKGSAWEINRQTGMITVYKEEQGQRIAHTKPFYEFDAYLVNLPTHQGIIRYQFALKHRYEDLVIGNLFSGGAFDSQQEGWAMWYFVQNYMDISRPLPEMGSLERSRHLDPTTVQYDKQTDRNPRYWRDMSKSEWKQVCYQMGAKIAKLPLGGKPDLMTQYVDYSHAKSFATRE